MPTLTTSWQAVAVRSVQISSNTTGYNILYAKYSNINYHTDRVYWESCFYAYSPYGVYTGWSRTYNDPWSCTFNGQSQSGSRQQGTINTKTTPYNQISYNDTKTYVSGYFDVDHTNAWTGTISYTGYLATTNGTLSADLTLNALFVPSIPSLASTAYIGDSVTINTNRINSSYIHNLYYSLDGTNYNTIATNIGASYDWTIPTSFYASIPNAKQITFYIKCGTGDGVNYGETYISATAYVKESENYPTISSVTYTPDTKTQQVAGQNYVIGNFSSVSVSFTANALHSASVSQVFLWTGSSSSPNIIARANGSGSTYNATLSYDATTYPVYTGVTDSRGITVLNITNAIPSSSSYYKDYKVLSVDSAPTIKRDSQTSSDVSIQSFTGNFWVGNFNGSNANALTIKFKYAEVSYDEQWSSEYTIPSSYITIDSQNDTYTISNYTFNNGTSNINFNYQKAYKIQIIVSDLLQSKDYVTTIPVGIPAFVIFQDMLKIKGQTIDDFVRPKINTYSTSEQVVGTWTDGKPLYRKCFLISSQDTYHNISNLDYTKIVSAMVYDPNFYGARDVSNDIIFQSIKFWLIGNALSLVSNGINLIVEYTKTTD